MQDRFYGEGQSPTSLRQNIPFKRTIILPKSQSLKQSLKSEPVDIGETEKWRNSSGGKICEWKTFGSVVVAGKGPEGQERVEQ